MRVRVVASIAAIAIGLPALLFSAIADDLGFGSTSAASMTRHAAATSPASPPVSGAPVASSAGPASAAPSTGLPLLRAAPVTVSAPGFWSWALLDTRSGTITGSTTLAQPSDTASMIKAWIASDVLRRSTTAPSKAKLREISIMIRDSDNDAAEDLYESAGRSASIKRLLAVCALTDSKVGPGWSTTMLSARDAARMGACIADGRAAGPAWTPWVLNEMRQVRGAGRYGIIQALPADATKTLAIKNGWLLRVDGQWHVNCLAVGDGWVLSVMQRYPGRLGVGHGWAVCRSVAHQLLAH
jgi:hypothetical protein